MAISTQQLSEQFKHELLFRKKDLEESIPSLRDLSLIPIAEAMRREINRIDATIEEIDRIDAISK